MIKKTLQKILRNFCYPNESLPQPVAASERKILDAVAPFTMTSTSRLHALIDSVEFVCRNEVSGDFVECGVWRGGSSMAAMLKFIELGDTSRHFHLYDTFEGMSEPSEKDIDVNGEKADKLLAETTKGTGIWCYADLDDVKKNTASTGYPANHINFVPGKVEETIPEHLPGEIAILRLDTDWYESTRHELVHLLPLLHPDGILIIDDFGHWQGARAAVEEFFSENKVSPFLHRVDYTGRLIQGNPIKRVNRN